MTSQLESRKVGETLTRVQKSVNMTSGALAKTFGETTLTDLHKIATELKSDGESLPNISGTTAAKRSSRLIFIQGKIGSLLLETAQESQTTDIDDLKVGTTLTLIQKSVDLTSGASAKSFGEITLTDLNKIATELKPDNESLPNVDGTNEAKRFAFLKFIQGKLVPLLMNLQTAQTRSPPGNGELAVNFLAGQTAREWLINAEVVPPSGLSAAILNKEFDSIGAESLVLMANAVKDLPNTAGEVTNSPDCDGMTVSEKKTALLRYLASRLVKAAAATQNSGDNGNEIGDNSGAGGGTTGGSRLRFAATTHRSNILANTAGATDIRQAVEDFVPREGLSDEDYDAQVAAVANDIPGIILNKNMGIKVKVATFRRWLTNPRNQAKHETPDEMYDHVAALAAAVNLSGNDGQGSHEEPSFSASASKAVKSLPPKFKLVAKQAYEFELRNPRAMDQLLATPEHQINESMVGINPNIQALLMAPQSVQDKLEGKVGAVVNYLFRTSVDVVEKAIFPSSVHLSPVASTSCPFRDSAEDLVRGNVVFKNFMRALHELSKSDMRVKRLMEGATAAETSALWQKYR
jgi:hypothetical protein